MFLPPLTSGPTAAWQAAGPFHLPGVILRSMYVCCVWTSLVSTNRPRRLSKPERRRRHTTMCFFFTMSPPYLNLRQVFFFPRLPHRYYTPRYPATPLLSRFLPPFTVCVFLFVAPTHLFRASVSPLTYIYGRYRLRN